MPQPRRSKWQRRSSWQWMARTPLPPSFGIAAIVGRYGSCSWRVPSREMGSRKSCFFQKHAGSKREAAAKLYVYRHGVTMFYIDLT